MKRTTILFVIAIMTFGMSTGYAQPGKYGKGKDSVECRNSLSFYNDYYKQGNLVEAIPLWREAFRLCPPGVRATFYQHGEKIFKYLIEKNKSNAQLKSKLIDSLYLMYDLRTEYFPQYTIGAQTNKAFDMFGYMGDKSPKVYEALGNVVKLAGNNTDPSILVIYMQVAVNLFNEKQISADNVLDLYSRLTPIIEYQVKASVTEAPQAKKDIDLLFANSGVASCENIVAMFGPKFNENPNDKELISRIVRLLNDAQCFKEELYVTAVGCLHRQDPSYKTALYLYKLYASREEHQNAVKFLQEAIDYPESNDSEDADMLIDMATYYLQKMGSPLKAAETAKLAIQKSTNVAGKANYILGLIWASQKCGGNEVEQRAKYWVAVDYFNRARSFADAAPLMEELTSRIREYSQYFPLQEEAFMYDIVDGSSFTVSCGGMSATTTVRTRKQ
ncbi:MAG: hypothetical protein WC833_02115 [Bacteroidales bacterium]|jgi:tetratricopeptide (TPR) repeat protein